MDATRFDAFARFVAARGSRRRVIGLLAGLGVLSAAPAARAAAQADDDGGTCPEIVCPVGTHCIVCTKEGTKCATCRCYKENTKCLGGIAGGGAVRTASDGEAHLSLVATRSLVPGQTDAYHVIGQVRWSDPAWEGAGLVLESSVVASYGPLPDVETGRQVVGWMRSEQTPASLPFVLRVVDAGPPGSAADTAALWVGDAVLDDAVFADPDVTSVFGTDLESTGFRYTAEGSLVSGDLQLVNLGDPSAEEN